MSDSKYSALHNEEHGESEVPTVWAQKQRSKRHTFGFAALSCLLLLSGAFNILTYYKSAIPDITYKWHSDINLESAKDGFYERWQEDKDVEEWTSARYNPYAGMIAVDEDFIEKHDLPYSQRWPWDQTKSMYFLSAWHSLHCLHVIRDVLNAVESHTKSEWGMHHARHCLYSLREDVVCYADDTPLYTGSLHAERGRNPASPGMGQARKCRNWDQVRAFVDENSACYDPSRPAHNASVEERYKSCPGGERPWEKPAIL